MFHPGVSVTCPPGGGASRDTRREAITRLAGADRPSTAPCASVYAPVARHVIHAVEVAVERLETCPPIVTNTAPDGGTVKVIRGHAAAVKSTNAPVVVSGAAVTCF